MWLKRLLKAGLRSRRFLGGVGVGFFWPTPDVPLDYFLNHTVAIGNPERHVRKASHCGSKQQLSSHAMITLLLLVRATYMHGVVLHAHPVRGESHTQHNTTREVATTLLN